MRQPIDPIRCTQWRRDVSKVASQIFSSARVCIEEESTVTTMQSSPHTTNLVHFHHSIKINELFYIVEVIRNVWEGSSVAIHDWYKLTTVAWWFDLGSVVPVRGQFDIMTYHKWYMPIWDMGSPQHSHMTHQRWMNSDRSLQLSIKTHIPYYDATTIQNMTKECANQ